MLAVEGERKFIFLTGAPLKRSLEWTEDELCAPLQPCFVEGIPVELKNKRSTDDNHNAGHENVDKAPSWRFLPLEASHLPTGLTQMSRDHLPFEYSTYANEETFFLSTAEHSFISTIRDDYSSERSQVSESDKEDVFTQYYEHSFAIHENIPSSQIVGAETIDESFTTEPEDFSVAVSPRSQSDPEGQLARLRLTSSNLGDLKDMPNAAYLQSITPQTMTVNLVVGIISISQPRTIKTRKGGRSIELVEMLVGDNTKSGFGINIWLSPSPESNHSAHSDDPLRIRSSRLRPRDIVLVKTVALSSFRGQVYGQSLRKGLTTLDLLYRNVVDRDDERGAYSAVEIEQGALDESQIHKVRDVKDWVMRFVGASAGTLPSGRVSKFRVAGDKRMQALPNDTQ